MIKNIHIVDYGLGNLFSVAAAFKKIGVSPINVDKPEDITLADFLVLPGVGAFQKGMEALEKNGFIQAIQNHVNQGKPLLGICLGMQMLFESSNENGITQGLGIIPGNVVKISEANDLKIPHIGWSKLIAQDGKMQKTIDGKYVYFVHSYHPQTELKYTIATTDYQGIPITSFVNKGNIWGCQFHPEKSGETGLTLLKEILK